MATPREPSKKDDLGQQVVSLVNEQPSVCTGLIYGTLLLAGYLLVYSPGAVDMTRAKKSFKDRVARAALTEEASGLDASVKFQRDRLPGFTSEYAWMETFLNAARSSNVRLESLTPTLQSTSWLGRSVEVAVSVNVSGAYHDVLVFVRWLETDRPFHRICEISILPGKEGGVVAKLAIVVFQREAEKQAT